jgi:hypothetical protein
LSSKFSSSIFKKLRLSNQLIGFHAGAWWCDDLLTRTKPKEKFFFQGEDWCSSRVAIPMDRQSVVSFPPLNRSDASIEKRSNFFPRIEEITRTQLFSSSGMFDSPTEFSSER